MTYYTFCVAVLHVGQRFGLSVISWGRSVAYNRAVGGNPKSFHLHWKAVDCKPLAAERFTELKLACADLGLQLIDEGDHWHIEPAGPAEDPPAG